MSAIIKTQRLTLREFTKDDGEFVLELINSPGWLQFIGNRDIRTVEEAQIYLLTGPMTSYEKMGFGLYHVGLNDDGTSIGMCGLIKRDSLDNVDIGFAFLPQHYGKGYAIEAATATLNYARTELGIEHVVAITDTNNIKSIDLLKKLGLTYEKNIRLPYEDKELMMFSKPG